MVVIDSNILSYLVVPNAQAPIDSETGKPVTHVEERIRYLIERLEIDKKKIVIPTPVLAELLVVNRHKATEILDIINERGIFRSVSFNQRAAIELALVIEDEKFTRNLRIGANETKAKIRFDRQIIAIAKAENINTIYSDDDGIKSLGVRLGLTVYGIKDLKLPQITEDLFSELEAETHG